MKQTEHIPISELCTHYKLDVTFFDNLKSYGLIETVSLEQRPCIHQEQIGHLEKMIRLRQDLNINFEGIDTVVNLLQKMEKLQSELLEVKSRLRLYEEDN